MNGSSSADRSLVAIVAMTPEGVIGKDGDMPWRLSSDLKRFKRLTMGGTLIMGRKTFDSIGRPLPGRRTIVVTRSADWSADGTETAGSPQSAVEIAHSIPTAGVFVVGGAEIYRQLLPRCDEVLLTRVWASLAGDAIVELDLDDYQTLEISRIPASAKDDVPTEFLRLSKRTDFKKTL